jgi:hypothetical protein
MNRIFLVMVTLVLSSCAATAPSSGVPLQSPDSNPAVRCSFTKPLSKRLRVNWPPPISHSQSHDVQAARLNQMEAVVKLYLERKGYTVISNIKGLSELDTHTVDIDWDTAPSLFGDPTWNHSVNLRFFGSTVQDHRGYAFATWRRFESDSIDSILMQLTIAAVNQVPPAN